MGTMARTAVVAGTATAVVGGVHRHQDQKAASQQAENDQQQQLDAQQQQINAQQQQMNAQQAVPPQAAPMADSDRLDKLKELGQMRDQGLLTDQEFASEKARLLAS
jgi:hypothetical protein